MPQMVRALRWLPESVAEVRALRCSGRPASLLDVLAGWSAGQPKAVGVPHSELDRLGDEVRRYLAPYADAPDLPTAVMRARRDRRWQ